MKILFINPPFSPEEAGGAKRSFRGVINIVPPLGLLYLAAVSEQRKHVVRIIDCFLNIGYNGILSEVKEFQPQVIGITATTPAFQSAVHIAERLRKVLPKTVFICGGAHPTCNPEGAAREEVFDYLVLGEGEETFTDLVSYLEDAPALSPDNIPGIAFRQNGKIIINPRRRMIDDLDNIPFPARHLLPPLSVYHPTPASYRKLPLAVIMTSRGCPSLCTFCDRAVFGEKFRKRSVPNVMTEVEEVISKYGAKEIRFFDDTFTLDPSHVEGICRAMRKLRPRIPWTCLTKVTAVSFDMLKMMREAGCWQVLFGLESGDDYVLQHLGKRNTVEQNRRVVLRAKKLGLSVRADFLMGSPWETKETFRKTVKFAKSLPLDFAHFNKFVPYSGTAIYKELINKGYKINFDKGSYINNPNDFVYIPETLNESEYRKLLNRAYREFYLRPGYILRRLLSLRSFSEFIGQAKGFFSILSL